MLYVYPDYYKEFKCIKDKCRHNCCIGWEIDIDDDTACRYLQVKGRLGEQLKNNISFEGGAHFVLGEKDRCPFLNKDNLCDIIIDLGEKQLCQICADHPRFRNELPNRIEIGLGLCCEAAAKLILGKLTPTILVFEGEKTEEDEIIKLRDEIILSLQNRKLSIEKRTEKILKLCGIQSFNFDAEKAYNLLINLERLDDEWTGFLLKLKKECDEAGFDEYMRGRETEFEQLLVYFIYRHFVTAANIQDAAQTAAFAVFSYNVIRKISVAVFNEKGSFTFEDFTEICRMYSSEIEYSDENLYILFDEIIDYTLNFNA